MFPLFFRVSSWILGTVRTGKSRVTQDCRPGSLPEEEMRWFWALQMASWAVEVAIVWPRADYLTDLNPKAFICTTGTFWSPYIQVFPNCGFAHCHVLSNIGIFIALSPHWWAIRSSAQTYIFPSLEETLHLGCPQRLFEVCVFHPWPLGITAISVVKSLGSY